MQLTNIVALLAAAVATGVQAAPNAALAERQQVFVGYVRFYGGGGCQEPWIEDTVLIQGDGCSAQTYAGPYGSFNIQSNPFTRTVRLYTATACGTGNYIDVKPGKTGCFAGKINSYSFL